jgi:maleate isomerase
MSKNRTQSMPEQIDTIIRAAELVADAKVDVIVLQASSFAMEKGPDAEAKVVESIARATGIAALTSTQAMVQALRELALQRLILVSPSAKAMSDAESAYLRALGFQVVNALGLDVESGAGLAMTPSAWLDVVKSVDRPEADGYFLSGSNTTIVEAIGLIERSGGKPVVTSTQATLWAGARRLISKLGKVSFAPELGRLFAHL